MTASGLSVMMTQASTGLSAGRGVGKVPNSFGILDGGIRVSNAIPVVYTR